MGFNSGFKGLREEQSLKGFKNRVVGKIFGLKREEVTGGFEKIA